MLREDEHCGLRVVAADLGGGAHPFVVVVGRHAHVDDGEVGLVLGDDDEERVGVADPRDDLVAGVLEQAREALAQEDRVLGDHDPHGISASSRVPAPGGLSIRSVPPWASTRSARPVNPVPPDSRRPTDAVVGDHQP